MQDTTSVTFNIQRKGIPRAVFIDYWFLWAIAIVFAVLRIIQATKKKKKE